MGCVHTRTRTFYSFPYQNSEEGLSTNNLSSTTMGTGYQIAGDADHKADCSSSPRKGPKYSMDAHIGKHQTKGFGRIESFSKIATLQESLVDTTKRRGFFRSKSDDQQQFGQVNFLDCNEKVEYKRHHRSENQLPIIDNTGGGKGKHYVARRQSDL